MADRRPLLLDLFSGAGGAAVGYHRAGFDVVGVDINPQKRYPFRFIQADAMTFPLEGFDAIHASPPCQKYSAMQHVHRDREYPDLIAPMRCRLQQSGLPYVIENVMGAPLQSPLLLCGTMFSLDVIRHRLFEIWPLVLFPPAQCSHWKRCAKQGRPVDLERQYVTVTGHFGNAEIGRRAMGIDWMNRDELSQAIPPAYTEYVGRALLAVVTQAPALVVA